MSRQDPGAAEGQGVYPTFPDCRCGDPYMVHDIGQRAGQQVRTACSRSGCDCRLYRSPS